MNHRVFFGHIRETVFAGHIRQSQVDGLARILDYREAEYTAMRDDAFAYLLATATWESGRTMQPVREAGGTRYLRSKPYYPWYGRGLVQVTWEANYRKFDVENPDDMLHWPNALNAIFKGMTDGIFTGRKLSDYFSSQRRDFVHAREIINGLDRARIIASIATSYFHALEEADFPITA